MDNNQQITPQMLQQLLTQYLQTNPMANWNIPTNPMYAMWMSNMANMMNNQNMTQPQQPQQNQNDSQPVQPPSKTDINEPAVRMISSPDEIKADEIPMNGSIRLFLQEDMNVIYGKRWTNNGVIENIRFVREDQPDVSKPVETQKEFDQNALYEGIANMIDQKLDQFRKDYLLDKRGSSKANKKEVIADGE